MKETYNALMNTYTKDKYELIFDIREKRKTVDDFKQDALAFIHQYYPMEEDAEGVVNSLAENLFGYSVLTPLIEDKDISDIKIHAYNNIIIKKKGRRYESDLHFENEEQYKRFIEAVITRNKVNASNVNAITRFTDKDTFDDFILRFTLVTPFITSNHEYVLTIRKHLKDFPEIEDLVQEEMMPPEIADYLLNTMKHSSILICGAMSSGKTTFLNALKERIPRDKSVVVIQQAEELASKNHPDMIMLHSIEGRSESDTRYNLQDLTIAALTLDVQYTIVGEIKGAEAAYLLNAANTGTVCMGTIHAESASEALDRIVDYAISSSSYSKREMMSMLKSIRTIVFLKNFKIAEIDEVEDYNAQTEKMSYRPVYRNSVPEEENEDVA